MYTRAFALSAVLATTAHIKYGEANCDGLTGATKVGSAVTIDEDSNAFFSTGFPFSYPTSQTTTITNSGTDAAPVCITFNKFDLGTSGTLTFTDADGENVHTFTGSTLPKPFMFNPYNAENSGTNGEIVFKTNLNDAEMGFRFICSDTPCPCTVADPDGDAFDQVGDAIVSNGEDGTINVNGADGAMVCATFADVDLQDGELMITDESRPFTGDSPIGSLTLTAGDEIEFVAGIKNPGSFSVTCTAGACSAEVVTPCTIYNYAAGSLVQNMETISSMDYNVKANGEYGESLNGFIEVKGPACVEFADTFGIAAGDSLRYQNSVFTGTTTSPDAISVRAGQLHYMQFLTSSTSPGAAGFQLTCTAGVCDVPTTTTTTTTTTQSPTTATSTTTTEVTQRCSTSECRNLVKRKTNELLEENGCNDLKRKEKKQCKKGVKSQLPEKGKAKKLCDQSNRLSTCSDPFWN